MTHRDTHIPDKGANGEYLIVSFRIKFHVLITRRGPSIILRPSALSKNTASFTFIITLCFKIWHENLVFSTKL